MTGISISSLEKGSIFQDKVKNPNIFDITTPKILNFSQYTLTESEISLLKKGLNFCPTPEFPDLLDLEVNLRDFIRLLSLKDNFGSSSNNAPIPDHLVRKTGEYLPTESKDMFFNGVIFNIKKMSENLEKLLDKKSKIYSNISPAENKALKKLRENKNIIIKKADKGGSIVIMDTSYYVDKVTETLNDTNIYKKCKMKDIKSSMNKVKSFLKTNKKYLDINNYESQYIGNFDFVASSFYGLPKIHKSDSIQRIMKTANNICLEMEPPIDLTFRFITAGTNSPTSKLSEFLDIILKPFLSVIPSYIRDVTDFLNKMPKFREDEISDIQIVTCDVISLYPSMEKTLILKAVKYWLTNFPTLLHSRFDENFVLKAVQLILENSHFVFNDQCFNLICGTATGTTVAPTLANLTMGFLETILYDRVFIEYGQHVFDYVKLNWKRYLDDGQIFWKKSFGPIENFVKMLNNLDSKINFTHEVSNKGLPFLNVFIYIEKNQLLTDIYYKKTDSHDYLPFNSCHPRHIKINIPKTLARTICTIVQDPFRKDFRLNELKKWLLKAGYPLDLINNGFSEILSVDQLELRTKKITTGQNLLPFVQTHNPRNPEVYSFLVKSFKFLLTSEKYKQLFKDVKLIKSERQPKNLGRLLQSSFFSPQTPKWGVNRCNQKNCGTCLYLMEQDCVYFAGANLDFKIKTEFTCESRNLIYAIFCSGCNLYYIGSTGNLRQRVTGHKKDLRKEEKSQLVYKHLSECLLNKNTVTPFKIIPFYKCKTKTFASRVAVENYFRRKLNPQLNGY